jgi:hypothetical protein
MPRQTDTVVNELRENLAEVEARFKPLEQERDRLRAMIAAADGKLKLGGEAPSTGTGKRKASVPLEKAKNRLAHLVRQKPNQPGTFYKGELSDIPANTVDDALKALVTDKKIKATGEKKARRYAAASS